jgi:hypothetical protein
LAGPSSTTSAPPSAGPTVLAVSFTAPRRPPARVNRSSSSPVIAASRRRCDDEYAGKNAPTRRPITSRRGNDSVPAQKSSGTDPTSTARAKSEKIIMRRGPRNVATGPPHSPRSEMPTNSAARTAPMRVGDPVDTRTNHGSAIAVISVPVVETTSARNSPIRERAPASARRRAEPGIRPGSPRRPSRPPA